MTMVSYNCTTTQIIKWKDKKVFLFLVFLLLVFSASYGQEVPYSIRLIDPVEQEQMFDLDKVLQFGVFHFNSEMEAPGQSAPFSSYSNDSGMGLSPPGPSTSSEPFSSPLMRAPSVGGDPIGGLPGTPTEPISNGNGMWIMLFCVSIYFLFKCIRTRRYHSFNE